MPSKAPPKVPDTKPSRGDDEDNDLLMKSLEGGSGTSVKRKSHSSSRGSGNSRRRSSHRHSSSVSSSSKDHKSTSRSPTRSSHRRFSTSKNDEKQKLRLIESKDSEIASPGAIAVKDGSSSRSSHRRSSKTPTSKSSSKDEKQKLRLAEAAAPPLFPSPGASSAVSDRRGKKESSKSSSSKTPDSKSKKLKENKVRLANGVACKIPSPNLVPSHDDLEEATEKQEGMPTVEAATAPDLREMLEAARQQGREEERQRERVQGREEVGELVVAQPASTSEGKTKKRLFAAAFCFIVVAAAGVMAWLLLHRNEKSSNPQGTLPSEEDCNAVSMGIVPSSQKKTNATAYGV